MTLKHLAAKITHKNAHKFDTIVWRKEWNNAIYAPINVNPVRGECGQGVGIWQILKFFDQIPQGGKRKVDQSVKKPPPQGKKSKQTIL